MYGRGVVTLGKQESEEPEALDPDAVESDANREYAAVE